MFFVYYVVVAAIAFWAISTHPQTGGRPFLSLIGALIVPLTLPAVLIVGVMYWAYRKLRTRRELTDEEIKELILRCAEKRNAEFNFPNLRYKRISDFASAHHGDCEWFPNYAGMRFWVDINSGSYAVHVETIDSDSEDKSGVVVSARADGAAVS